ncbi:MAG TPA: hypothetical protein VNJ31_10240 [Methyloceanibacter sp.]|nr:hypothetical protein [Methyloceanibacter sp.]
MQRALTSLILAALTSAFFTTRGETGQPGCVEWSQAGPVIAQNGLIPANVVYQKVKKRFGGKIVSQALCNVGGRFVYKLVVLGPTGEVTNVTVDAQTGQF